MSDWLQNNLGLSVSVQGQIAVSCIIVLVLLVARRLVLGLVWGQTHDAKLRYRWQKATTYLVSLIGVLLLGRVWFGGFHEAGNFLGLFAAGIAIALKDILVNIAGWLFMIWRRPFLVGDRIQIGTMAGDVIDVRLFHFTLNEIGNWVDADQSTGRVIHIPNGRVLTDVIANYSEGFEYIWNEIPVLVTMESDWERAKQILLEIVQRDSAEIVKAAEESVKHSTKKFMILYTTLTPTVYTKVGEDGVVLTMRYLCEPRKRRVTEQTIWEDVLRAFAKEPQIDLGYITRRGFNNTYEGKPALRPK
ncbi:MAG TPA: mechanosensitive ion channel domain-containing protein [Gemmatimonadales bacterium]|nr:mechanosensitive ion channel domain-containing protein [Gemmatimonadales bacterium]